MSVIDEVKQKTDIVEVIGQYLPLKKAGRNLVGLCPFHGEKHPSFFVYPEQQSWHCFGCNTGGDVFSFVMKKENIDFGEVLRLLAQKAGITIPSRFEKEEGKGEKERLYQLNELAAGYYHDLLLNSPDAEKARRYVADRGFSAKTVADFQLGFSLNKWDSLKQYLLDREYAENELLTAGLAVESENGKVHDRFRNKLMFPITDIKGRIIGFGARVLDDSLPKYVNSPQTPLFDKSRSLYGINLAAPVIRQQGATVIVEGYIDAMTAQQSGFSNVVASMGTSVTEEQVTSLKKLSRNITLALDADAAGKEAMLRGVSYENTLEAEVRVVTLPQDKDPDDVIKENAETWQNLLAEAMPIMDYTFNMFTAKLDLTAARDKSLAVEKLLPIIAEMKDGVRQAHYVQKLARMVQVGERVIEEKLSLLKPRPIRRSSPAPRQETTTAATHPVMSSKLEEGCLALLLQHPELKSTPQELRPEYFANSENREIFLAWQQASDIATIKELLDPSLHEYLDPLLKQSFPPNQLEQKYAEYTRRLRERYLKNLEEKRGEKFALEATLKGAGADLAKLEEEGIEPSIQLKEVFTQKDRRRLETKR
ncbi:DNA primase [Chloroflexota bacterium]